MRKLLAGLLMVPCMAHAEFWTGNDLLNRLNDTEAMGRVTGLGYIIGIADAFQKVSICMPSQVTAGQARDVVKEFLEKNASVRHFSADSLVTEALTRAWPCQNKKGTRS